MIDESTSIIANSTENECFIIEFNNIIVTKQWQVIDLIHLLQNLTRISSFYYLHHFQKDVY